MNAAPPRRRDSVLACPRPRRRRDAEMPRQRPGLSAAAAPRCRGRDADRRRRDTADPSFGSPVPFRLRHGHSLISPRPGTDMVLPPPPGAPAGGVSSGSGAPPNRLRGVSVRRSGADGLRAAARLAHAQIAAAASRMLCLVYKCSCQVYVFCCAAPTAVSLRVRHAVLGVPIYERCWSLRRVSSQALGGRRCWVK